MVKDDAMATEAVADGFNLEYARTKIPASIGDEVLKVNNLGFND